MFYGKQTTTKVLDENGSIQVSIKNYRKGEVVKPVKQTFEIKNRVHNQKEEQEVYLQFSDEVARDRTKLDPHFKLERSKVGDKEGYYYAVACYSKLEY